MLTKLAKKYQKMSKNMLIFNNNILFYIFNYVMILIIMIMIILKGQVSDAGFRRLSEVFKLFLRGRPGPLGVPSPHFEHHWSESCTGICCGHHLPGHSHPHQNNQLDFSLLYVSEVSRWGAGPEGDAAWKHLKSQRSKVTHSHKHQFSGHMWRSS